MSPTVFISSTIYDFQDLRSALRYWLEGQGFRVQVSEDSDFEDPTSRNSYEACLDAIRACDVFILLIGGRRGGLYDKEQRVSITQQEYRVAYEECRKRSLPVVVFVRQSVWDWADYHRQLMSGASAEPSNVKDALQSANKHIEDPDHLLAFLREVSRTGEMKAAISEGTELPTSNWVYRFSSFGDVLKALEVALRLKHSLTQKSLLSFVELEVGEILRKLILKMDGRIRPFYDLVESTQVTFPISAARHNPPITLPPNLSLDLTLFALLRVFRPRYTAIQTAAYAPELGRFDLQTGRYTPTSLQKAIERVLSIISEVAAQPFQEFLSQNFRVLVTGRSLDQQGQSHTLQEFELLSVYYTANLIKRLTLECANLMAHLRLGEPLLDRPAAHVPRSPIAGTDDDVEAETPTDDEVLSITQRLRRNMTQDAPS